VDSRQGTRRPLDLGRHRISTRYAESLAIASCRLTFAVQQLRCVIFTCNAEKLKPKTDVIRRNGACQKSVESVLMKVERVCGQKDFLKRLFLSLDERERDVMDGDWWEW